ncbi:hypothetical protein RRG08_060683 [Elysia crispata]|uniref:Uncharacterized protein n=1 Tax=Elysia crispata TaxID=231223 RepID=A0AAE0YRI9_9GAST|nr:hypothetical protein RRG08_060683 [Elysia crispata]
MKSGTYVCRSNRNWFQIAEGNHSQRLLFFCLYHGDHAPQPAAATFPPSNCQHHHHQSPTPSAEYSNQQPYESAQRAPLPAATIFHQSNMASVAYNFMTVDPNAHNRRYEDNGTNDPRDNRPLPDPIREYSSSAGRPSLDPIRRQSSVVVDMAGGGGGGGDATASMKRRRGRKKSSAATAEKVKDNKTEKYNCGPKKSAHKSQSSTEDRKYSIRYSNTRCVYGISSVNRPDQIKPTRLYKILTNSVNGFETRNQVEAASECLPQVLTSGGDKTPRPGSFTAMVRDKSCQMSSPRRPLAKSGVFTRHRVTIVITVFVMKTSDWSPRLL